MKAIQIGLWRFGRTFREGLTSTPGVEVSAILDHSREALDEGREFYGLASEKCYSDLYSEWFETSGAEFAVVALPHGDHYDAAMRAFRNGMDVIMVKPLSDDYDHAVRMVREAERNGRKLVVAQQLRFHPPVLKLREVVTEGVIGEIVHIDVQAFFGRSGPVRDKWHQDYPLLVEAAIHHLDLVRWITELDAQAVIADSWNMPWHDDAWGLKSAVGLYEMTNGSRCLFQGLSCESSKGAPYPGRYVIEGTDGIARLENNRVYVDDTEVTSSAGKEPPGLSLSAYNAEVIRRAVKYFSGESETGLDGRENLRSLAMVLGAIESHETGRRVELAEWFS